MTENQRNALRRLLIKLGPSRTPVTDADLEDIQRLGLDAVETAGQFNYLLERVDSELGMIERRIKDQLRENEPLLFILANVLADARTFRASLNTRFTWWAGDQTDVDDAGEKRL